ATAGRGRSASRSSRATASRSAAASAATTPATMMLTMVTTTAASRCSATATSIATAGRNRATVATTATAVMTVASDGLAFTAHQGDTNHREENRDAEQESTIHPKSSNNKQYRVSDVQINRCRLAAFLNRFPRQQGSELR